MTKKFLVILLTAVMIVTSLAGCSKSSSDSEEKTTGNKETTTDTVTDEAAPDTTTAPDTATESNIGGKLVIWEHTSSMETPLKAVTEGFNKKYPNVEIEYQIKTSDQYYNLLATAIQAGETPDLFYTNGTATENLKAYVDSGVVMDLTDSLDLSIFDKDVYSMITIDGKIYASPTAELGGRAVFYNKDIFAELGLSIPKTFDEFESMLAVIAKSDYLPISFAASDPWTALFQFDPILNALHPEWSQDWYAGKRVKINDDRLVDTYNKMLEWADLGYYGAGYTGVSGESATLAFSTGKAALYIDGTWNVATIKENNPDLNFGAFHLPDANGVRSFTATSSVGFSVAKDTENPDAALAFLNYFASLEGQTLWINGMGAIPRIDAIESTDPVINELKNYDVITGDFYTILGSEAAEGQDPRTIWEEDHTKVFSGGLTPKEFLDELAAMTVLGK